MAFKHLRQNKHETSSSLYLCVRAYIKRLLYEIGKGQGRNVKGFMRHPQQQVSNNFNVIYGENSEDYLAIYGRTGRIRYDNYLTAVTTRFEQ